MSRVQGHDPIGSLDYANKQYVDSTAGGASLPVGAIILWPAISLPAPYLYCQGQAVSRVTYSALFAVIGTAYGAGDGSTTFNIPNFNDRSPMGVGASIARGQVSDRATHFHNTQTSTDLNTGSGGFAHEHFFGEGVNTFDDSDDHQHNSGGGTGLSGGAADGHRHSLQGIITSQGTANHSHNIGTHNHGGTLSGGGVLNALGVYFAIKA